MTNDETELARRKVEDFERAYAATLSEPTKQTAIIAVACFANLAETALRNVEILHRSSVVQGFLLKLALRAITPDGKHLHGYILVKPEAIEVAITGGLIR